MHLKRWITSLIALPLLILLIVKAPPVYFVIFICVVSIVSSWEFFHIVFFNTEKQWGTNPIIIVAYVIGPIMVWATYRYTSSFLIGVFFLNLMLCSILSLHQFKSTPSVVDILFKQMVCIIYAPLLLSYLVRIRCEPSGILWIFFLLCIVFSGDVGAYYTGKGIGKHKLCPAISPGKTWEGALGGVAANIGVGSLFKYFFLPDLPWISCLLMFVLMGALGIVGDLFESELKRISGIKDSGTILPGHGGILDRIDALLFAAPVIYYYKVLVLTGVG